MHASGSSSELSSHQMAIRSHPGVQKMPASGIPSELSAHQMAPAGAIAHSRAHLCPHASTLSFSTLVSPLRPLGLGFLGRCDPRSFFFYDVMDAGPASHRVRLWQGGPASTCCRFRPRCAVARSCALVVVWVHVFFEYMAKITLNFTSAPGLSGGRGEMAMAVASSARLAFLRGAVCARRTLRQMLSLFGPCAAMVH